jgi:hypothetical protein
LLLFYKKEESFFSEEKKKRLLSVWFLFHAVRPTSSSSYRFAFGFGGWRIGPGRPAVGAG